MLSWEHIWNIRVGRDPPGSSSPTPVCVQEPQESHHVLSLFYFAGYARQEVYVIQSTFSCALAFNLSQMDTILDLQQINYSPVLLLFNGQCRQVFPLLDPNMVCPQDILTESSTPRMNKNQMKVNKHNGLITVIS